eukprot:6192563-Prymnesium_polylepis.1
MRREPVPGSPLTPAAHTRASCRQTGATRRPAVADQLHQADGRGQDDLRQEGRLRGRGQGRQRDRLDQEAQERHLQGHHRHALGAPPRRRGDQPTRPPARCRLDAHAAEPRDVAAGRRARTAWPAGRRQRVHVARAKGGEVRHGSPPSAGGLGWQCRAPQGVLAAVASGSGRLR